MTGSSALPIKRGPHDEWRVMAGDELSSARTDHRHHRVSRSPVSSCSSFTSSGRTLLPRRVRDHGPVRRRGAVFRSDRSSDPLHVRATDDPTARGRRARWRSRGPSNGRLSRTTKRDDLERVMETATTPLKSTHTEGWNRVAPRHPVTHQTPAVADGGRAAVSASIQVESVI